MKPTLRLDEALDPAPCRPALIWAEDIEPPAPSEALPGLLAELVHRAAEAGEGFWPADIKARVRQMLRHGKYKPSGRSKPASEFLLKAALTGRFPAINPAVDANNAISLESGLPGSIFDTDLSGERLLLRHGRAGERYVFNPTGQEIDLTDLLLLARDDDGPGPGPGIPCGNPVKDSMATKIQPDTRRLVAVLYAPADEPAERLEAWARRYADLLAEWCGAASSGYTL